MKTNLNNFRQLFRLLAIAAMFGISLNMLSACGTENPGTTDPTTSPSTTAPTPTETTQPAKPKHPLAGTTWIWESAYDNDGKSYQPSDKKKFTIGFGANRELTITGDCNSLRGKIKKLKKSELVLETVAMTRMACPKSSEADYVKLLSQVVMFHVDQDGKLILELKYDSGAMVFVKSRA